MKLKMLLCMTLAVLLLTACGLKQGQSDNAGQILHTFTDDLGREVNTGEIERVAVMIGSFADVWCLAGGRDTIVAAADDSWTSFELELNENTADLGAVKTPSLEVLLASRPDLVIASCNTVSNLELEEILDKAGIPAAYFDVQSFDDYLHMLKICTDLTGCPENYERYGTEVAKAVEAAVSRQDGSSPRILCMRATGSSCKIKGSRDFLLGEMLAELGCVNVADGGSTALEELSLEAIMDADPDYVFCVLQGADSSAAMDTLEKTLLSNPAWSSLRAVRNGNFYTLEHSLYNLKPNARWGEAYEKLADILYPEEAG